MFKNLIKVPKLCCKQFIRLISAALRKYFSLSLVHRLLGGFILGSLLGFVLWTFDVYSLEWGRVLVDQYFYLAGEAFIRAMKMVVVPIVFFSVLLGAARMPIKRSGVLGSKLMGIYFFTSFAAAAIGILVARWMAPGSEGKAIWQQFVDPTQVEQIRNNLESKKSLTQILLSMLENPFTALSGTNFLGFIFFSVVFGLALSYLSEQNGDKGQKKHLESLIAAIEVISSALIVMVRWIMEYAPVGILALSAQNFTKFGPHLVGPYLKTTLGIVICVVLMMFLVYGGLIYFFRGGKVIFFLKSIREALVTAFVTRSSAATLPVSMKVVTENLKVNPSIARFSLPIGATVNMDGVCVHLPMFAILAANMNGIDLGFADLFILTLSTVLAAIGAGGVPGGSLMLLFMILNSMQLGDDQIAVIVSIAMGINPILDMFETMNNVAGDIACTYAVAGESSEEETCLEGLEAGQVESLAEELVTDPQPS